jgi:hypothetical protein
MKNYLVFRLLSIGLISLFFLSTVTTAGIVFASSSDWSEVTKFTGSGTEYYTTDFFTCEHVERRIRWEYFPNPGLPLAIFSVYTYSQGEDTLYIDSIIKLGANDTNGTSYIHENDGTFYSKINAANTESYTIIIEQDLNSIPEFPSWIIFPLFLVATLVSIIVRKKLRRP